MSEPEISEARRVFLAAYRDWLVRYAIHLAVREAQASDGTVELLRIRRMLEEDEVMEHGFEDGALLWLLDITRIGPFARRQNGVAALMAAPKEHPHELTWPHPGSPPTPAQSVRDQVSRVESAHDEAAPKRGRRARSA